MSESQLGERNAEKIGVYRVRKLMVYICPKSGEDRWCLLRHAVGVVRTYMDMI